MLGFIYKNENHVDHYGGKLGNGLYEFYFLYFPTLLQMNETQFNRIVMTVNVIWAIWKRGSSPPFMAAIWN